MTYDLEFASFKWHTMKEVVACVFCSREPVVGANRPDNKQRRPEWKRHIKKRPYWAIRVEPRENPVPVADAIGRDFCFFRK